MKRRNDLGFTTHDEVGAWYTNKFQEMGGSWHVPDEELDELLDLLGVTYNNKLTYLGSVLELGCGDGKLLARIRERGRNAVGIDVSEEAQRLTLVRMHRLDCANQGTHDDEEHQEYCVPFEGDSGACWEFHLVPMESTGFASNRFEWAISYGSMEHALDIAAACRELYRVLKPGGRFCNYAPNELWEHFDQPLETTATEAEWIQWCTGAGLVIDQTTRRGDNTIYIGHKPGAMNDAAL